MQKAAIASPDSLRQPPFTVIGDPENLSLPVLLHDMPELTPQPAARCADCFFTHIPIFMAHEDYGP